MHEFHHIAAITWRIFNGNRHSPTEVHLFTPTLPRAISEVSLEQQDLDSSFFDYSLAEDSSSRSNTSSLENATENFKSFQSSSTLNTNEFNAQDEANTMDSIQTDHSVLESSLVSSDLFQNKESSLENNSATYNLHDFNESNREKSKVCNKFSCPKNLINDPRRKTYNFSYETKYNFCRPNEHNLAKLVTKSKTKIKEKSQSNLPKHDNKTSAESWPSKLKHSTSIDKNKYNSLPTTSFKLSEFLKCLKTKEGKQYLVPWIPDSEKKSFTICSHFTNNQKNLLNQNSKKQSTKSVKDLAKYKTELCRSYQYNKYCEYNESCLYAHGTKDLRSYPKHPLYRTKQCFSFHKKGFCLYGSRCQFLHDIE